jgi:3-phenylpropionate/trans-cinnamate dioxygenase ferredoxin subunit
MANEFVKVATVSEIPDGSVKLVDVAGQRMVICHVEKSFYAVADLCSHDNGPLGEGELFDHQIECPRHGARFDIKTGKAMCLPAVTPIPAYSVEIRGEEVWVSPSLAAKSEAKN